VKITDLAQENDNSMKPSRKEDYLKLRNKYCVTQQFSRFYKLIAVVFKNLLQFLRHLIFLLFFTSRYLFLAFKFSKNVDFCTQNNTKSGKNTILGLNDKNTFFFSNEPNIKMFV